MMPGVMYAGQPKVAVSIFARRSKAFSAVRMLYKSRLSALQLYVRLAAYE